MDGEDGSIILRTGVELLIGIDLPVTALGRLTIGRFNSGANFGDMGAGHFTGKPEKYFKNHKGLITETESHGRDFEARDSIPGKDCHERAQGFKGSMR